MFGIIYGACFSLVNWNPGLYEEVGSWLAGRKSAKELQQQTSNVNNNWMASMEKGAGKSVRESSPPVIGAGSVTSSSSDGVGSPYKCGFCLGGMREPATLHCGHSFCLECATSAEKKEEITCPTCGDTTRFTRTKRTLPVNITLRVSHI